MNTSGNGDTSDPSWKPKCLHEALDFLVAAMSDAQRAQAASQSSFEFTMGTHFGIGLWIRNAWVHGETLAFLKTDDYIHADEVSAWLLKKLHQKLRGLTIDPNAKPVFWMDEVGDDDQGQ